MQRWTCPHASGNLRALAQTHPEDLLEAQVGPFLRWSQPVQGALFVFGGRSGRLGDSRQYLKTVEYLDPTDLQWRSAPDMRTPRVGLAVAYLEDYYYIIGGYNSSSGDDVDNPQKTVEKLHVQTLTWSSCAPLVVPRYGHSACTCRGKIYVMGGDHSGVLIPYAERYDPTTDSWEKLPDMPIRVAASRAVCLNGKVFVFGGCDPSVPGDRASDSILVFDPDSIMWTVLGLKMALGRTAFSIAPIAPVKGSLDDGVVIAGGFDLSARPEVEMASVELLSGLGGLARDDHAIQHDIPSLPLPRAGCQGVYLPLMHLPVSMDKSTSLPVIVLGGEYVDPMTGKCKIFDSATMLVHKEFAKSKNNAMSPKITYMVRKMLGRDAPSPPHSLTWADNVIPPMKHPRTAFAACVGSVWPNGHLPCDIHRRSTSASDSSPLTIPWSNLLQEWLQGNVF